MHAMWKGSISFGLVNVPVKMFAATENKDVTFRYLHKECRTPIRYVRTCPTCQREVEWHEIVKGYEAQPGQYVLFPEEELNQLAPSKDKTIQIMEFVHLREIDPIYFDKSYYLTAEDTGKKAYILLRQALQETERIAVARMTIRSRQNLCIIRCYQDVLLLETIFYPDEVRSTAWLPQMPAVPIDEKELQLAKQLIEQLSLPFDPAKYSDDYRSRLLEAVEAKVQEEKLEQAGEPADNRVVDLMKILQESLQAHQGQRGESPLPRGPATVSSLPRAFEQEGEQGEGKKPRRRHRQTS